MELMVFDVAANLSIFTQAQQYVFDLIEKAMQFDPVSIGILAAAIIFFAVLIFHITKFVWHILKRFILVIIIFTSLYFFVTNFYDKIFTHPDPNIIVVGAIGALFGLIALFVAVFAVKRSLGERELSGVMEAEIEGKGKGIEQRERKETFEFKLPTTKDEVVKEMKSDKSLLAVLSYIIIAEFGVFSSVTIAAPNISVGIVFAGVFFLGALIFIRNAYKSYLRGFAHLCFALIFGGVLSILLAHYWVLLPLEMLLSIEYFKSPALVALVTGISISLLMESRN